MATEIAVIQDKVNVRSQAVAESAEPGTIAIQNIAGVLKQVDDQGTVTSLGGGGGSGTVTSVAATASGLLAVAGTPTVAPTVGMAALAAGTYVANITAGSAVPTAVTRASVITDLGIQAASAVAITGGTIAGVSITTSSVNMGGNSIYGNTTVNGNLTLASTSNGSLGLIKTAGGLFTIDDLHGYIKVGSSGTTLPFTTAIEIATATNAIDLALTGTGTQYINRTVGTGAASMGFTTSGNASGFVFYPGNTTLALQMLIASGVIKVGFFAAAPVAQQTVGANVNNVAASGTTGQFDDFTNGSVYATDYAALHATVYQLTRSVAQLTVAVRNFGLGA